MNARFGGALGLVGVAGNVAGVAALAGLPSAYRPGSMAAWIDEVARAPSAATASAASFTIGLVALAGWAIVLGDRLAAPSARFGGAAIAGGALLNAAGTLSPIVLVHHVGSGDRAVAAALLGASLALDALFNLLLAAGLVAFAVAFFARAREGRGGRALAVLAIVAAIVTAPVSMQITSDTAARLLVVAGPAWLAFILASSVQLLRGRA